MKNAAEWLDAIKRKHHVESDWAVAKLLDTNHAVISHYRAGRRAFDAYMAVKVAALLGIDPLKVIASAEAERSRDADRKDFWKRLAACVLVAAGAGTGAVTPQPAQAAPIEHNANYQLQNTHCARIPKRRRRTASLSAAVTEAFVRISRQTAPQPVL